MLSKITVAALAAGALAGALPVAARAQQDVERGQEQARAERERARAERELAQQQAQIDRQRAQAERERGQQQAQTDRERMREELERARAELEAAAREVARLSSQFAAPAVREAMQKARFAQQRAMLGIGTEDDARGVRVTAVSPNGPGAAAGLRAGDVIVAIDGAALLAQLENVQPGENVRLEVLRDGTQRSVTVQARERGRSYWWPENLDFDFDFDFDAPRVAVNPFWFGGGAQQAWRSMELVQLTPELGSYFGTERGLLVVRGPNRDGFGLRDGDVIIDIGGREPTSPEHATRILSSFEPGETLRMTIMRRQRRETLELQVPQPERR